MSEQPIVTHEPALHGTSQALREALDDARRRAPGLAPVLIIAEQGLEVPELAAYIHALSGRTGPLVRINAPELLSHHDRADTQPRVRESIDRAQGGTLLIEEVYELPLYAQAIIEDLLNQQVRSPPSADVRVIVSTSLNLADLVGEGEFRPGLLHRLMFGTVALPPLRERGLDVGLLAERLLRDHPYLASRRVTGLEPRAVKALIDHDWPDNLPELEAIVVRAALNARGEKLDDVDIEWALMSVATLFSCLGPDTEGYVRPRPPVPGLDEPADPDHDAPERSILVDPRRPLPSYDIAGKKVAERVFGQLRPAEQSQEEVEATLNMLVRIGFSRLLRRIDREGPLNLEEAMATLMLKKRHTRQLLAVLVEDGMLAVSDAEGEPRWSRPVEA